ncbi:6543_t:CDS:2 [Acaulospora colombiana]|uniref:6543_t:CDS:1 n=1 Tax=Acaulospora colombiana TaxID=27376 RepID=A0ACA9QCE7_9GLOM|nr:6543_t:CDS:2 [Acaulospora colombiana]
MTNVGTAAVELLDEEALTMSMALDLQHDLIDLGYTWRPPQSPFTRELSEKNE